jgi:hypothetical protein
MDPRVRPGDDIRGCGEAVPPISHVIPAEGEAAEPGSPRTAAPAETAMPYGTGEDCHAAAAAAPGDPG